MGLFAISTESPVPGMQDLTHRIRKAASSLYFGLV